MQITRHQRTTSIQALVPLDKEDIESMRIGYAVKRYFPAWLEQIREARNRAEKECKESYHLPEG